MPLMIPCRLFSSLSRNHCSKIFPSRPLQPTMIGLKSTLQGTASPAQLVIVEGNIGVGKSTLACQLAKQLNYRVFLEPTTKNPYLAKFYRDPKKYALKLQLWIFRQRFKTYVDATEHVLKYGQGVLLDRSVFSDSVFAEANYQHGTISQAGYDHYKQLREKSLEAMLIPHTTLYLDVQPKTCNQRILGRARDYEKSIPLDYLKELDAAYKKFLDEMREIGSRVLVYDWTDFGYKFEVAEDIKKGHVLEWKKENKDNFIKLSSQKSLIKDMLTLNHTLPEAVISEDEEEQHPNQKLKATKSDKQSEHYLSQHLAPPVKA
ncbi:deoxyguanosine kinase-like isoform X1 [Montipora foliosa]|uniref:deoxyguanosine kinase-like isoform X1 n=2 Tax=Montipora foliosa TaxID=591990 RepID=UPI0035F196C0